MCRFRYLLIEWHLNRARVEKRLAGLGLRLALESLLREGCAEPPRAVFYDEFEANNFAVPVPGLRERASMHTRWTNWYARILTTRTNRNLSSRWFSKGTLAEPPRIADSAR